MKLRRSCVFVLLLAACDAEAPVGSLDAIDGGPRPRDDANELCGTIEVATRRVTPTVLLLVDQSRSMEENEIDDGVTRWDAIKGTLLARPGGIVDEFDDRVRFGLALFSSLSTDEGEASTVIGACPRLTQVAPALDAYAALDGVLRDASTLLDTPTSDAIRAVLPSLIAQRGTDPALIVLATDGDPDTCAMPNPRTDENRRAAMDASLAAVREAYTAGVRTFVIGVGDRAVSRDHLVALANAGIGAPSGARYWEVGDLGGLGESLRAIVGGEVSCTLEVNGEVTEGLECTGTVELDGAAIGCDDPNGWRLRDPRHIELTGTACERFAGANGSRVTARFPCGSILF